MATLVERAREVISAESDNFFSDSTIEYYLNKSQNKVVSYMINRETGLISADIEVKSLRALDKLRGYTDIDVTDLTLSAVNDYFTTELTVPTEVNQFTFLRYNNNTPLKEITISELSRLTLGNLKPSANEGYYTLTNNGTNPVFEIYIHEDESAGSVGSHLFRIYYIGKPTAITSVAETLTELPEQLENAVIYGAALMMVMQESVKDPESQSNLFAQLYQEELQANTY